MAEPLPPPPPPGSPAPPAPPPPSQPTGPASGAPCPSCGVIVSYGYVTCPKCRTRMPRAHVAGPLRNLGRHGGTAVEGEGSSAVWLIALVLVAAVAGVGIWLLARGRSGSGAGEPAAVLDDGGLAAAGPAADDGGFPADARARRPAGPSPGDRADALADLQQELEGQRLWATVRIDELDPDTVVVESKFCADARVAAAVDQRLDRLRGLAYTAVRCEEPHGALVFERKP